MKTLLLALAGALSLTIISERIVSLPEIKERVQVQGMVLKPTKPEEFTRLVAADVAKLAKVAKAAGIKID